MLSVSALEPAVPVRSPNRVPAVRRRAAEFLACGPASAGWPSHISLRRGEKVRSGLGRWWLASDARGGIRSSAAVALRRKWLDSQGSAAVRWASLSRVQTCVGWFCTWRDTLTFPALAVPRLLPPSCAPLAVARVPRGATQAHAGRSRAQRGAPLPAEYPSRGRRGAALERSATRLSAARPPREESVHGIPLLRGSPPRAPLPLCACAARRRQRPPASLHSLSRLSGGRFPLDTDLLSLAAGARRRSRRLFLDSDASRSASRCGCLSRHPAAPWPNVTKAAACGPRSAKSGPLWPHMSPWVMATDARPHELTVGRQSTLGIALPASWGALARRRSS